MKIQNSTTRITVGFEPTAFCRPTLLNKHNIGSFLNYSHDWQVKFVYHTETRKLGVCLYGVTDEDVQHKDISKKCFGGICKDAVFGGKIGIFRFSKTDVVQLWLSGGSEAYGIPTKEQLGIIKEYLKGLLAALRVDFTIKEILKDNTLSYKFLINRRDTLTT